MTTVDDADRNLIVATQAGLPLAPRPYAELAHRLGTTETDVPTRLQRMLDEGVIRRIGVVPNHYAIGYTANGMSVWDLDDGEVDRLGAAVGALDGVTHCYRRPRHLPDWPYNLFAMVHGRDRDAVQDQVSRIATLLGAHCRAHDVLYSTRILKKTGLRIAG